MTTDRSRPRRAGALTQLEWKLVLTTVLGLGYVFAWWATSTRTDATVAERASREPEVTNAQPIDVAPNPPRILWLSQLPASERPMIAIPPGYQLAIDSAPSPASASTSDRALGRTATLSRRRPIRIRTRSS